MLDWLIQQPGTKRKEIFYFWKFQGTTSYLYEGCCRYKLAAFHFEQFLSVPSYYALFESWPCSLEAFCTKMSCTARLGVGIVRATVVFPTGTCSTATCLSSTQISPTLPCSFSTLVLYVFSICTPELIRTVNVKMFV